MLAEFTTNKKGVDHNLPFGGEICIPPGALGKKDVVTCCIVSPSDRFKHLPPIRYASKGHCFINNYYTYMYILEGVSFLHTDLLQYSSILEIKTRIILIFLQIKKVIYFHAFIVFRPSRIWFMPSMILKFDLSTTCRNI